MQLVPGLTIGQYRLIEPAGSGGMAVVWRAYHPRLERYVAIKFLSPQYATDPMFLERFQREARAVSRLEHPNILTIYDYGEQDGWTYMVSPFIGGGTLSAQLRRGPWTVEEAVAVLEPLASALDYAHGEGIVHRDIKPSNILFTDRGRLVLSDFGIARILEASTLLSHAGLIVGTPMYMSPEQADGQPAGPASDLYSLGVVAYEMLTGRPPFTAETPLALLRAHIDKPLPPPRTINPDLSDAAESVLFKIMAKDPAHRFRSGAAFVDALRIAQPKSSGFDEPPQGSQGSISSGSLDPLDVSQPTAHVKPPLGPTSRQAHQVVISARIPTVRASLPRRRFAALCGGLVGSAGLAALLLRLEWTPPSLPPPTTSPPAATVLPPLPGFGAPRASKDSSGDNRLISGRLHKESDCLRV